MNSFPLGRLIRKHHVTITDLRPMDCDCHMMAAKWKSEILLQDLGLPSKVNFHVVCSLFYQKILIDSNNDDIVTSRIIIKDDKIHLQPNS